MKNQNIATFLFDCVLRKFSDKRPSPPATCNIQLTPYGRDKVNYCNVCGEFRNTECEKSLKKTNETTKS